MRARATVIDGDRSKLAIAVKVNARENRSLPENALICVRLFTFTRIIMLKRPRFSRVNATGPFGRRNARFNYAITRSCAFITQSASSGIVERNPDSCIMLMIMAGIQSSIPGLIILTLGSDSISRASRFHSPEMPTANTTNVPLALREGDVISRLAEGNGKDSPGRPCSSTLIGKRFDNDKIHSA